MKGSLKIVGTILSMLVVFLIFIWVLSVVLGSPECDDLANNTAYNLKLAIDEVSTSKVGITDPGADPDPTQYRTAVVRLCQEDYLWSKLAGQGKTENIADQIYSWVLKLSGGEPQYKIYHEVFPEEGLMWKESYPWSAGAASTFAFWAVMRGVSIGIEYLSPYVLSLKTGWSLLKWLRGVSQAEDAIQFASDNFVMINGRPIILTQVIMNFDSFITLDSKDKINIDKKLFENAIFLDSDRRKAAEVAQRLNKMYSQSIISALANESFIRKGSDGSWIRVGSKIALNNEELPMIFPKKEFIDNKWQITEEDAIYVYQAGGGELDPEKADWNKVEYQKATRTATGYNVPLPSDSANYVLLTFKPNELVKNMHDELIKSSDPNDKQKASDLESYWYWDEADAGTTFTADDVLQTKYGFEIYNIGYEKFRKNMDTLQKQGVLTKDTVLHSGDITQMLVGFRKSAFAGDADARNIQDAFLSILGDTDNSVFGKICYVLNRTEGCTVSINDMFDALQSNLSSIKKSGLYHPEVGTGGIMLLWENFSINIDVKIMDIIMTHPGGVTRDFLLSEVRQFNKVGYTDDEIWNIYNTQYNWFVDPSGGNGDVSLVPEGMGKFYLKRWANALSQVPTTPTPSQYKWAVDDIGFIIGLFMQESSTTSTSVPPKYQRSIAASGFDNKTNQVSFNGGLIWEIVKRPLFWNIKQIITPSSGIAKGFLLQSTEGCLGNSLCVYSHGALMNPESPMYLNESAKKFRVRLWRPISPLVNVGIFQNWLMQVPSHPRFYVVSPCFGLAKVWKSKYQGENTIFVKIDKFDLNDTASNYCYADENLINGYAAIWFASDAGQIIEAVAMSSVKRAISEAAQAGVKAGLKLTLAKVFLDLDPVTLARGFAEAAISWPGWPFKSLTFEEMIKGAGGALGGGKPFGPP